MKISDSEAESDVSSEVEAESSKSASDSESIIDEKEKGQKKRKMLQPKKDWIAKDMSKSNSLVNSWNKVLLEAKCLRDFFVDEAVIPTHKILTQDPDFLSCKIYETSFMKMMSEKYQMDCPMIIQFFRDRFITQQS